jgi:hypothetical protein
MPTAGKLLFISAIVVVVAAIAARRSGFMRASTGVGPQAGVVNTPNPICGLTTDGLVRIPPDWATFMPPAVGQSYVDPVFGCTVKRLTNSSSDEVLQNGAHTSFVTYYSTFSPMNASDTMLLIYADDGSWRIKSTDGSVVVPRGNMPRMNNGHPVWDAANSNLFYYTLNNALYGGTINGNIVQSSPLRTFSEYSGIVSPDAADLSQDGDHIALVGQKANGTMDVFVYSLSRKLNTSLYATTCSIEGSVTSTTQPGCLHKIQLTADNRLTINFVQNGEGAEQGLRLWNGAELVHMQHQTSHYDTGYDLNGSPVFVSLGNAWSVPGLTNPCPSGWGLDARQINNLQASVCVLDSPPSWHISYRGGASQPWIAISFFDQRPEGPESYNASRELPTTNNWWLYENEIVLARVDNNNEKAGIYRLAHTRSRSAASYWAQPHAAISRDGKYVVFTSSMAYPNGCPANMHVANQCTDVYLIKVQ